MHTWWQQSNHSTQLRARQSLAATPAVADHNNISLLYSQWHRSRSGFTICKTAGVLNRVQEAVAHAVVVLRFMLEHMSTTYLAYWAEPRGFTELKACIHLASQGVAVQKQGRNVGLLDTLRGLDAYIHSSKFQYLRSKVLPLT